MKKSLAVFLLLLSSAALSATEAGGEFSLLILPVRQTVPDGQYEYLSNVISGILTLNLREQKNLSLADPEGKAIPNANANYSGMLEAIRRITGLDVFLLSEYFIEKGNLHITVTVIEAGSDRVKNSYIRVMPADLDMIKNIEEMAKYIAESVSKSLPKLSRDEILSRQVASELRDRLDKDERLIASIFGNSQEIALCPLAGIATGKGIGTWSKAGPMASTPIAFEYRYLDRRLWHIGLEIDYLPFDLMQSDWHRSEVSGAILAGTHTASLVSLSWGAGLFAAWSENDASAAISYLDGDDPVYPPAKRFSLGIPLEAGISYYWDRRWFTRLRFAYNGLSYTFENLIPADYPNGAETFRYDKGFSPWSLAHFSFTIFMGMRI
jgi:hypothetical protein